MSIKKLFLLSVLIISVAALVLVVNSRLELNSTVIMGGADSVFIDSDELTDPLAEYGGEAEAKDSHPGLSFPKIDINAAEYLLINSTHVVKDNTPNFVIVNTEGVQMDDAAYEPLLKLFKAAKEAGFAPYAESAYVSYTTQQQMFNAKADELAKSKSISFAEAKELARSYVAFPGTSDRQTGLGVTIVQLEGDNIPSDEEFYSWIDENCAEYGFIKRYPDEKKELTGWEESGYYRYVGVEAAKFISENGLCLEEFIAHYEITK